jgi:DNA-binding PadR family transcriptional regulator
VRAAILAVLSERPMHGYEIMQQLEERSGGFWRPSPGSVYPTLQLLEDQALLRGEEVEGRRVYSLTEQGRGAAEEARGRAGGPPWSAAGGPGAHHMQLRGAVHQLAAAVRQVGMAGDEAQTERALEILADARKRLYALLAGD